MNLSIMTQPTSLEADAERLWSLLFQLVLDGEKRFAALLDDHGLTTPQFYVLKTLTEHDGRCPIGQIAQLHSLTNATMTGLIKRLEALDMVIRETNVMDRRSVTVVISDLGRERYRSVQENLTEQLRGLLSLLPEGERRHLIDDVERYSSLILGLGVHS